MKQAARVIKKICDRRTADDACSFCLFCDICRTEPVHMGGMTMTERERLLEKIRKVQARGCKLAAQTAKSSQPPPCLTGS